MLTQVEEGEYRLEDLTSQVPFVLHHHDDDDEEEEVIEPGLFTENSIVVAEGEMVDGTFRVHHMALPPPESR